MLTEEQIATEGAIYEENLVAWAKTALPPPGRGMSLQLLRDGRAQHMGTDRVPYTIHHITDQHITLRAGEGRYAELMVYAITDRGRLKSRGIDTLHVAFVACIPLARRRWTGKAVRAALAITR